MADGTLTGAVLTEDNIEEQITIDTTAMLDPIPNRQTKIEIVNDIAAQTGLQKKDVHAVFSHLMSHIHRHMMPGGSGEIILPSIGIKVRRIHKGPSKERSMVSPLTGSRVEIEAKPARDSIKLVALKKIKDLVE